MTKLESLNFAQKELSKILPFVDNNAISDCINILKGKIIVDVADDISDEDCEVILDSIKSISPVEFSGDILSLISIMMNEAREKTRGSSIPSRIYISSEDHDGLLNKIGLDRSNLTVLGAKIVKSDKLLKQSNVSAICISKPKFNNLPISMIITTGVLKDV